VTKLLQCADAVTAVLNSTTWESPAWGGTTAERRWAPKNKLANAQTKAFVIPREATQTALNRALNEERCTVLVVLVVKPNDFDNAAVDPVVQLLGEIRDHFFRQSLAGVTGATCVEASLAVPDDEEMQNSRNLAATVALTFRVFG